MILIQALRNAMVNDLVVRNVADLTATPAGRPGRPPRSLDLEQALAVLDAARGERLWPYVAVSMLGGIRAEEARALAGPKQVAARAEAGAAWKGNDLVFCTSPGGPTHATDVRMECKRITEKAGVRRDWRPHELRRAFVSLLSDSGVPIEQIADAVGHSSARTTEVVHRHQLRPVTRTAAVAPGPLFESRGRPTEART